jgi:hypothetical protein
MPGMILRCTANVAAELMLRSDLGTYGRLSRALTAHITSAACFNFGTCKLSGQLSFRGSFLFVRDAGKFM